MVLRPGIESFFMRRLLFVLLSVLCLRDMGVTSAEEKKPIPIGWLC